MSDVGVDQRDLATRSTDDSQQLGRITDVVQDSGSENDVERVAPEQFVLDVGNDELDALGAAQRTSQLAPLDTERARLDTDDVRCAAFGERQRESTLETAEVDHGATIQRPAARVDDEVRAHVGERIDSIARGGLEAATEGDPMHREGKKIPPTSGPITLHDDRLGIGHASAQRRPRRRTARCRSGPDRGHRATGHLDSMAAVS